MLHMHVPARLWFENQICGGIRWNGYYNGTTSEMRRRTRALEGWLVTSVFHLDVTELGFSLIRH